MACDGTTDGRTETDPVSLMRNLARREVLSTFGPRVMKLSGAFAGLFRLDYGEKIFQRNYRNPVLVAAQAGAGSKAALAVRTGRLADLAQDVAATCANDMLTIGAEPLFLLHHVSGTDLSGAQDQQIIEGLAEGCRQAGCALLSSERTQAAGQGGFDLATFAVGVCDHRKLIRGDGIEPGDDIIGIASSGLHRSGFDVAVKVAFEQAGLTAETPVEELGCTLGEELLRPSRIYVGPVLRVLRYYRRKQVVPGIVHVSDGGLAGSLERILPAGCQVRLEAGAWSRLAIFDLLGRWGVPVEQMWRTFNMGIGLVLVVRPAFTQSIVRQLRRRKMKAWHIGSVGKGDRRVEIVA